jgi:hypothetical protein
MGKKDEKTKRNESACARFFLQIWRKTPSKRSAQFEWIARFVRLQPAPLALWNFSALSSNIKLVRKASGNIFVRLVLFGLGVNFFQVGMNADYEWWLRMMAVNDGCEWWNDECGW